MTNQEILTRAIEKSIAGGWDIMDKFEANKIDVIEDVFSGNYMVGFLQNDDAKEVLTNTKHYTEIIFNHDFAKALWGEKLDESKEYYVNFTFEGDDGSKDNRETDYQRAYWSGKAYQYRLQQMVIADDPIKYLGDNI